MAFYDANIRYMAQQTRNITYGAHIQSFRYDQLMRLNSFRSFKPDANGLSLWNLASTASAGVAGTAPLQTDSKEESITYDRNGNLSNYQRWGTGSATLMDNLGYVLYPNSNRLEYVVDGVAAGTFGSDFDGQSPANYAYDGAGNLIKDAQSGISTGDILWTPYGKVRQVNVLGGITVTKYDYDAQQNRVFKSIQNFAGTNNTYYVRDIQGNVMATYTQNGTTFTWAEQHLYGSSRLGMLRPEVSWSTAPPAIPHFASTRLLRYGTKRYEVNDHLGNVRASISDRRQFSSTIFDPVISDATDYFPFGAPNRSVSSSAGYRYGFNGKELDKSNEFGTANVYDYGFRIYNPSIGRFLSVDPLTRSYSPVSMVFFDPACLPLHEKSLIS
jgi:RHS repeat-associated protein